MPNEREESPISLVSYYGLVIRQGLRDAWGFIASKLIYGLAVFIVSSIVGWFVRGGAFTIESLARSFLEGVVPVAILTIIIVGYQLIAAPVKIYRSVNDELAGFRHAKAFKDRKPRIRLEADNPTRGERDKWVCIRIWNDEDENLANCKAKLMSVVDEATGQELLSAPEVLQWSSSNPPLTGMQTVPRSGSLLIDIARSDHNKDRIYYTTQRGDWLPRPAGTYTVSARVWGDIQGSPVMPIDFQGRITYHGHVNLKIEKVN